MFKDIREGIMFTAELVFVLNENRDSDLAVDSIYSLLGALRLNGQILGKGISYRTEGFEIPMFHSYSRVLFFG